MRNFFVTFIVAFVLVLSGAAVHGQKLDLTKVQKVPRYTDLSQEKFEAETQLREEKPFDDKYLAYTIRIPGNWTRSPEDWQQKLQQQQQEEEERKAEIVLGTAQESGATTGLSRRILGRLAKYYSPSRMGLPSYVDVSALELDYEISVRDWFLNYIMTRGYTLQGMEEVNSKRIEALYIIFEGDTSYVVRTVAEINGPRIVVASYYMPENFWMEERAFQEKVMSSFQFVSPEKPKIETARTYSFLEMLRFDYPASWNLFAPNVNSIDSMDVRLVNLNKDDTVNGQIDFHVFSTEMDTTLADEVEFVKDNTKEAGLDIGELIETTDAFKFNDYLFYSRVEVYDAPPRKDTRLPQHELWMAVLAEDRYYYIVTLLTPSRSADFFSWARNYAAYKRILESIRP